VAHRCHARALGDERADPLLGAVVDELSLSDRQACCIVRALLRRPRILILDEATSALDVATRDRLFALIGRLVAEGVGVVFITHRMDEIDQIGDRITVMRSGETVASLDRRSSTPQALVRLMTGADELVTALHAPAGQLGMHPPVAVGAVRVVERLLDEQFYLFPSSRGRRARVAPPFVVS